MRNLQVGPNDAGQRLDRFLSKALPALPAGLCSKFIRTKYIKLNGQRTEGSARLSEGDVITFYINDRFFLTADSDDAYRAADKPVNILYEDENILLAVKEPGLSVHEDESGDPDTLINRIKSYLEKNGSWDPAVENAFAPALCNRIDRNTGGIVIAAKNAEALREMNELIRTRSIDKFYLACVNDRLPRSGQLKGYLMKIESENRVVVRDEPFPGARTAITEYKVLAEKDGLSLVECRLVTGRTHQIRAQMAHAGYPLLGDGKYGKADERRRYQALFSYRLVFSFKEEIGRLDYLRGRSFTVTDVDFMARYFPDFHIL